MRKNDTGKKSPEDLEDVAEGTESELKKNQSSRKVKQRNRGREEGVVDGEEDKERWPEDRWESLAIPL